MQNNILNVVTPASTRMRVELIAATQSSECRNITASLVCRLVGEFCGGDGRPVQRKQLSKATISGLGIRASKCSQLRSAHAHEQSHRPFLLEHFAVKLRVSAEDVLRIRKRQVVRAAGALAAARHPRHRLRALDPQHRHERRAILHRQPICSPASRPSVALRRRTRIHATAHTPRRWSVRLAFPAAAEAVTGCAHATQRAAVPCCCATARARFQSTVTPMYAAVDIINTIELSGTSESARTVG